MNNYKIIAFDLDDTLVDDTKSRKFAFANVCNYLGLPYSDEYGNDFIQFDNSFWNDWESGKITIPKETKDFATYLRSLRFQKYFQALSINFKTAMMLNEIYCNHLGECIEPINGARETLEILKEKYKLIITTNGVKKLIQHKLDIVGISSFISNIISAEDVGKNKPHPLFFNYLFKTCDCSKSEVLLIGDSLTSDILGGMQNGIDTCWFNSKHLELPQEYIPTMEINHLLELTRKL